MVDIKFKIILIFFTFLPRLSYLRRPLSPPSWHIMIIIYKVATPFWTFRVLSPRYKNSCFQSPLNLFHSFGLSWKKSLSYSLSDDKNENYLEGNLSCTSLWLVFMAFLPEGNVPWFVMRGFCSLQYQFLPAILEILDLMTLRQDSNLALLWYGWLICDSFNFSLFSFLYFVIVK